jgi:cell division protein FtsB
MNKYGHSRPVYPETAASEHGFFYRLVSSQRFLAIIGLAFLVIIIFPLARAHSQKLMVEREIAEVKRQIEEFETQNQELKDLMAYLQSDQSLEEQARLNLNLKKPGEAVIVIEDKPLPEKEIIKNDVTPGSRREKWLKYFFD